MNEPLIVEHRFAANPSRIWEALTTLEELRQWYFDLPHFEARVGFEYEFTGGDEKVQYLHRCKITEVIPGQRLTHTWEYPGLEGGSVVQWDVLPEGDGTLLRITHYGLETFPGTADSNFAPASFQAGWTYILGSSLAGFLGEGAEEE